MEIRNINALKIYALIIAVMCGVVLIINLIERNVSASLADIALIISWVVIYFLLKNYEHDD